MADGPEPPDSEGAPGECITQTINVWREPLEPLPPGSRVDRYLVIDRLGQGGMGVVFRAFDPDLNRPVALKLVLPGPRSPNEESSSLGKVRLLNEAQALAQLSHPNVVAVYDVGTHANAVFIAMELIEGLTLNRWLENNRPPRGAVLEILMAAGYGLSAAHQANIVHRDFKPSNIIIGRDGRVRVVDFGLAQAAPVLAADTHRSSENRPRSGMDATSGSTAITVRGQFAGTPRYMAPEQLQGLEVDQRADQFSFAVVMFQTLHGRRPFEGESPEELSESISRRRFTAPLPSEPFVPAWIDKIIARGLEARPEDRFGSMAELLRALATDPEISGKVLLVDDSQVVRNVIGAKLSSVGLEVVCAASGEEALQAIARAPVGEPFHLFILDICMPEINGLEVVAKIRANPLVQDTPILLFTSLSDTANHVRGLQAGADDFLNKAIPDAELLARVRSFISFGKLRIRSAALNRQMTRLHSIDRVEHSDPKEEERILLVTEDRVWGEVVRAALAAMGRLVVPVDRPEAVWENLEHPCSIVLADFALAIGGPERLLSALKERKFRPAVIVLDRTPALERRLISMEAGADDYLPASTAAAELCAHADSVARRLRRYRDASAHRDQALVAAVSDPLTGLYNHSFFQQTIRYELERSKRYTLSATLLFVDIDRFRAVNDILGHAAGDVVLQQVTDRIVASIRATDIVARYGGDVFALLLTHTACQEAEMVAERIRTCVSANPVRLPSAEEVAVTVSVGMASFPESGRTSEEIIERTDAALNSAKLAGRNRVSFAPEETPSTAGPQT